MAQTVRPATRTRRAVAVLVAVLAFAVALGCSGGRGGDTASDEQLNAYVNRLVDNTSVKGTECCDADTGQVTVAKENVLTDGSSELTEGSHRVQLSYVAVAQDTGVAALEARLKATGAARSTRAGWWTWRGRELRVVPGLTTSNLQLPDGYQAVAVAYGDLARWTPQTG